MLEIDWFETTRVHTDCFPALPCIEISKPHIPYESTSSGYAERPGGWQREYSDMTMHDTRCVGV